MEDQEKKEVILQNNDHIQMMPLAQAQAWYNEFGAFTKSILKSDIDFGVIPGTPKPSLLKPGAEKLRFAYGLGVEFEMIDKVVDLDKPFVDYTYRCTVKSKSGQTLSQCEGNCNSMEIKFGYVWVSESDLPTSIDKTKLKSKQSGKNQFEFCFAIDKAETTGQYGKPAEYWNKWKAAIKDGTAKKAVKNSKAGKPLDGWELGEVSTVFRITDPDIIGKKNTIMKMSQKRAFVGAILLATGASEYFTQDIEDMEINGQIYTNDINPDADIQTAEVIKTDINKSEDKKESSTKPDPIPGHWYAKLEKCKTKEDLDELAVSNKETLQANSDLKLLFQQRKAQLPHAEEVQDDLPF